MKLTYILLSVLLISNLVFAGDTVTYEEPVLMTSIGQAADVLIMKGLCKRAAVDVTVKTMATTDSLEGFKALILVAGGSSKGLGAAKVNVKDELERGKKLIKAAKKAKLPIITFHIGGEARRGALSDKFNELAAEKAELIVVASDGDMDELFKKLADKNKARYIHIEKSFEAIAVLKELFPEVPEEEVKE